MDKVLKKLSEKYSFEYEEIKRVFEIVKDYKQIESILKETIKNNTHPLSIVNNNLHMFARTEDEKQLEADAFSGKWKSGNISEFLERVNGKPEKITLYLNSADKTAIQRMATANGMKYQPFISSILHRYVTEQFLDKKTVDYLLHSKKRKTPVL